MVQEVHGLCWGGAGVMCFSVWVFLGFCGDGVWCYGAGFGMVLGVVGVVWRCCEGGAEQEVIICFE